LLHQAALAADPELFAGLCHACRYNGLLEASVAAHEQTRRLDPKAATSVIHTYFQQRDFARVLACGDKGAPYLEAFALVELGRVEEALTLLRTVGGNAPPRMRDFMGVALALVSGQTAIDPATVTELESGFLHQVADPEGLYYASRHLARMGEPEIALRQFARAVDGGYTCYPAFASDPWLAPLAGRDEFQAVMARAQERYRAAVAAFRAADGERVVGVRLSADA
jgi:hypothetical protein